MKRIFKFGKVLFGLGASLAFAASLTNVFAAPPRFIIGDSNGDPSKLIAYDLPPVDYRENPNARFAMVNFINSLNIVRGRMVYSKDAGKKIKSDERQPSSAFYQDNLRAYLSTITSNAPNLQFNFLCGDSYDLSMATRDLLEREGFEHYILYINKVFSFAQNKVRCAVLYRHGDNWFVADPFAIVKNINLPGTCFEGEKSQIPLEQYIDGTRLLSAGSNVQFEVGIDNCSVFSNTWSGTAVKLEVFNDIWQRIVDFQRADDGVQDPILQGIMELQHANDGVQDPNLPPRDIQIEELLRDLQRQNGHEFHQHSLVSENFE